MTTKSRLTISSAVRRAYRRSDQFEKRRQLAQAWARYIAQPPTDGAVVPLRAGSTARLTAGAARQPRGNREDRDMDGLWLGWRLAVGLETQ